MIVRAGTQWIICLRLRPNTNVPFSIGLEGFWIDRSAPNCILIQWNSIWQLASLLTFRIWFFIPHLTPCLGTEPFVEYATETIIYNLLSYGYDLAPHLGIEGIEFLIGLGIYHTVLGTRPLPILEMWVDTCVHGKAPDWDSWKTNRKRKPALPSKLSTTLDLPDEGAKPKAEGILKWINLAKYKLEFSTPMEQSICLGHPRNTGAL